MNGRMVLAGVALLLGSTVPAIADAPQRADTLDTLGVGARSVGLGGAFVAVPDDVTAVYWNPAGLARLRRSQFAIDMRTLPKSSLRFDNSGDLTNTDLGSTGLQFSFIGFAFPEPKFGGTFGFSRTLAGYEQIHSVQVQDPSDHSQDLRQDELVRYWFNTIAYGRRVIGKTSEGRGLDVGLGLDFVQLHARTSSAQAGTNDSSSDTGMGVTFDLGALYSLDQQRKFTLGFNYLNPTSTDISRGAGAIFGSRIPGRVSGGAAYVWHSGDKSEALGTLEVRHIFGAEQSAGVFENRSNVTNVHAGVEYSLRSKAKKEGDPEPYRYSARLGFLTRFSPNDALYRDDQAITFGFGYRKMGALFVDVGVEVSTHTGNPVVVSSVRYNFGSKR